MRIGIFTETYCPYISGLVTSEVMLKKALEKQGHEVYVVTANLESFHYDYDEKERVLRIPGIPTGIYDSRLTSIYPIKAINKIKSWNLDVIHSQTEFAIGSFARLFAKQFNIPIVHTYHTMYEDYVHYITKGHFNKSSKKIVEYLTKFYCDKTITELIVPTKKAYDLFKRKYNVERNIHIIPTGIEIERFYKENVDSKKLSDLKRKYKIKKGEFVLIFVGRIAEEKNIPFIIDVMAGLMKKNIKLLIIGDGPDKEKYEKYTSDIGADNVIFTGKVPWDDIPVYYSLGTAFISASTTETQGLTIIEAMASSLPALCIDDESFNGTVVNDLNGFLFTDKKTCAEVILKLYDNKKLTSYLSNGARMSAEKHSSRYFAEQVLDVYLKAIRKKKEKGKIQMFMERMIPWRK
ncbi:MAG: glycosyltransferase family 4 protein [Bacilli bacterium]|nr:glycosyltransferase family 4 protein [Bacilli bacterium]